MKAMLACLGQLLILAMITCAQECPQVPVEWKMDVEKVPDITKSDYSDWVKFESQDISFYVPKDVKAFEGGGPHGMAVRSFKSDEIRIGLDSTDAAFYPSYPMTTYPSYKQRLFCIDGRNAWFWSFQEADNDHRAGVFFYFDKDPQRRLQMGFSSNDRESILKAEKIIRSIKFIENPSPN